MKLQAKPVKKKKKSRNAFVLSKIRLPEVWEIRDCPASEGSSGTPPQEDPGKMPQAAGTPVLPSWLPLGRLGLFFLSNVPPLFLSLTLCYSRLLLCCWILTGLFVVFGINFFIPCFLRFTVWDAVLNATSFHLPEAWWEVLPTLFHRCRKEGCVPLSWPSGQWLSEFKPACLSRALALPRPFTL